MQPNNTNPLTGPEGYLYTIEPDGRWRMKFDNHMISAFGTCEQLFKYKHVPNERGLVLQPKGGFSWYATFGIWWAHVQEDFYNHVERAQKQLDAPPTKADIIHYAVKHWRSDDLDRFVIDAPKHYEKFSQGYVGIQIEGRELKLPVGAVDLAMGYYDYYTTMRDFQNWKVIATEGTFGTEGDVVVAENDHVIVAYQGRPDLVIFNQSKGWVEPVDTKTTKSLDSNFASQWKPNAQLTGYVVCVQELCTQLEINASVSSCTINGAARDIPSKPRSGASPLARFERYRIEYSPDELARWRVQMLAKATRLRYCLEHDEWLWREVACHNQYNHPCDYRQMDSRPEKYRELIVNSGYQWVQPWNPKRS